MKEAKRYAERDIMAQGQVYADHVNAMTAEGLHEKSDIAAELAHRDLLIERLRAELAEADARGERRAQAAARDTAKAWEAERDALLGLIKAARCPNRHCTDGVVNGESPEPCEWCYRVGEALRGKP